MKIVTSIIVFVVILFAVAQLWAKNQIKDIEDYPYVVLETHGDFELRQYEKANFICATMDAESYRESSSRGFNILAGYIFGGNKSGQKIAMTSPVVMDMDDKITMKFLVPAQYDLNDLPEPDNVKVKFKTEREQKMAAITFGGFADDDAITKYREKLFTALEEKGFEHSGDWSFMGYDPPYKVTGRKNEVVVRLD